MENATIEKAKEHFGRIVEEQLKRDQLGRM